MVKQYLQFFIRNVMVKIIIITIIMTIIIIDIIIIINTLFNVSKTKYYTV